MNKIVILVAFLFLIVTEIEGKNNDTIYYECPNELSFDTIPYMVKDMAFIEGFNELRNMFIGKDPYSLKRAEFIVEWAYSGGKMEYAKYCRDIDSVVCVLKRFIKQKNIQNYKTAPNYALFEYFTRPNSMNGHKEFLYDFDDITGKNDFRNLFITKVMNAHKGQCISLSLYYKILCDELGGQSSLALDPRHIYIKHIGEDGNWVNIELTNGHFVRDEWIIQTTNVSTESIRNGIFLSALSDKENIALMITQLGKAYQQKYNSWDYFPLKCADEVLKTLPNFCDALILKFCVHQQLGVAFQKRYGDVHTQYIVKHHEEFQRIINTLDSLGYSQQTDEEYKQRVKRALMDYVDKVN